MKEKHEDYLQSLSNIRNDLYRAFCRPTKNEVVGSVGGAVLWVEGGHDDKSEN